MAEYFPERDRLTVKLVYYGPAMSGKTTNLMRLHDLLAPDMTGEMMALETRNDRTLFFDLLPLGVRTAAGLTVHLKLFTVPGQVAHNSTRKAVLSRADGVVFVADSQVSQGTNNSEAFENLEMNVQQLGMDFERLPLVVQFNKRDLPAIVAEEELRDRWQASPWPVTFASALAGHGVLETFHLALERLYPVLDARYQLQAQHALDRQTFVNSLSRQDHGYQPV